MKIKRIEQEGSMSRCKHGLIITKNKENILIVSSVQFIAMINREDKEVILKKMDFYKFTSAARGVEFDMAIQIATSAIKQGKEHKTISLIDLDAEYVKNVPLKM